MNRIVTILVLLAGALMLSACKKKEAAEPETPAAESEAPKSASAPGKEVLPGTKDVKAALASKNYNQAVEGVMALQAAAVTPEQKEAWGGLFGEVRSELQDASSTNPKAAEALANLRAIRVGR